LKTYDFPMYQQYMKDMGEADSNVKRDEVTGQYVAKLSAVCHKKILMKVVQHVDKRFIEQNELIKSLFISQGRAIEASTRTIKDQIAGVIPVR
jgi:hypothetical protein